MRYKNVTFKKNHLKIKYVIAKPIVYLVSSHFYFVQKGLSFTALKHSECEFEFNFNVRDLRRYL